jgi:hypothetical protein
MDFLPPGLNDQRNATSSDLSSLQFASANITGHIILGEPSSGMTNEFRSGIQDIPTSSLSQPSMQSMLSTFPYKQSLGPNQSSSAPSLPYHRPSRPNSKKNSRKRARSPKTTHGQEPSVIQRLAKNSGVPENCIHALSNCQSPPAKSSRSPSQKQDKKDVLKAGGSCLFCHFLKRKVASCLASSFLFDAYTS